MASSVTVLEAAIWVIHSTTSFTAIDENEFPTICCKTSTKTQVNTTTLQYKNTLQYIGHDNRFCHPLRHSARAEHGLIRQAIASSHAGPDKCQTLRHKRTDTSVCPITRFSLCPLVRCVCQGRPSYGWTKRDVS